MKKENEFQTRRLKSPDGILRIIFDSKLHSWEEAALQYPKDMKKKDEYYLYGIQHTKDEWLEQRRDRNGVSPAHNPSCTEIK
jgi:hypothetical protein